MASIADQNSRQYTMRRLVSGLVWLFLGGALCACAHSIEPEPVRPGVAMPENWSLYGETSPVPDRWWEGFGSEELVRLVDMALESNPTLRVSLARLEQSRALAVQAGADELPDLDLSASVSETRRRANDQTTTGSSRSLSLASSYEVDLWGRVRESKGSALLEVEASREDLYTAAMTLVSEITLSWLETVSIRQQLQLLDDQLETNETILELLELRYLKGFATALDIYQQRQIVAETKAALPSLEGRLQTLLNRLAVLTGNPPDTDLGIESDRFPAVDKLPRTGVPADLLAKRPDVRAAGMRLRASQSRAAAARAARLPSLNLTANTGFSSERLGELLDNWFATLAASLVWPLFDAGERDAEADRRRSITDERLADYERTVLEAIQEVEDALIVEKKQVEYIAALEEQLAIAKDSFREAQQRYRKGLIDYLPALSALISAQRFERTVVQARLERLNQRVKLHRALGGGWMAEEFEQADRSTR